MPKSVIAFAPGRVELLGNHTDYNEGLVLAAAIDLGVTARAERLDEDVLEVSSETTGRPATASLDRPKPFTGDSSCVNYPLGVIWALREAGLAIGGLRLQVSSNLPLGWGLSSSAAFEVSTALAALSLYDLSVEPMTLAKLCQKAENEFVGVKCGLLDQASSVFGRLMFESHESSKRNFGNSTSFLDILVEIAAATPGVLGARLAGGGFGGATIWLVEKAQAPAILRTVPDVYHRKTGATCKVLLTKPSQGARPLQA